MNESPSHPWTPDRPPGSGDEETEALPVPAREVPRQQRTRLHWIWGIGRAVQGCLYGFNVTGIGWWLGKYK